MADGQGFSLFLKKVSVSPELAGVEDTWLNPNLDFVVHEDTGEVAQPGQ